jgi:hypothetical protein
MTQINAMSGINQIVAYTNRKASQLPGASVSALSYVSSNTVLTASYLNSVASAINTLVNYIDSGIQLSRLASTPFTADKRLKASDLTAMQSALYPWVLNFSTFVGTGHNKHASEFTNPDSDYPGIFNSWAYGISSPYVLGKVEGSTLGVGSLHRERAGVYFPLDGIGTSATAVFGFTALATNTSESFSPALYLSSTDDSAFSTGWESNLDTLAGTCSAGNGAQTIAISNSVLASRQNATMSLILGTDVEMSGGGTTATGSYDVTNNSGGSFTLTITY